MIFKRQVKVQPVAYLSLNMAVYWKAQWERIKKSRHRTSGPPAFWGKPIRCVVKAWGCLCRPPPVDIIPPCPHPSSRQNQAITSSTQAKTVRSETYCPRRCSCLLILPLSPPSFIFLSALLTPIPLFFSLSIPPFPMQEFYLLNMHFLSTSH